MHETLPLPVIAILVFATLLVSAKIGHRSRGWFHRKKERVPPDTGGQATAPLLLLLSVSLTIILDLDRPRDGAVQVSQQALEDLKRSME